MIKQHVETSYKEHRLEGIDKIIYDYTHYANTYLLTMRIPEFNITKQITGIKAKQSWDKMTAETWENLVSKIKLIACDSTNVVNSAFLHKKTRKKEIVFARNCVWWHCNKYFGFTQQMCGDIFGMDHASALYGIRDFYKSYNDDKNSNPDYIFQTLERRNWAERFIQKCREAYQIDKDIFKPKLLIHEKDLPQ